MQTSIGKSVPRADGFSKVTGSAKYVGDMYLPNMLYGSVLRSVAPHARIKKIDVSAALKVPGVHTVLTHEDLNDIDPYWGHALKDRPILAIDRVRFVGEPIAAVAAETLAAAQEAVDLIEVEYEDLPACTTIDEALAPDAPLVHEGDERRAGFFHGLDGVENFTGNICYQYNIKRGDSEKLFEEAAYVVEGEYTFPAVYQYAMETHTVLADYGPDGVTLWATCQHPYLVRAEIADLFNLPLSAVRIIVPYLGGGFGSKSYTKMEPVTVALARKARRPVLISNSVGEAMVTTRRHGMKCWMRTAADKDGRLLAREAKVWLDTGAYADNGPRVAATAGDAAPGPYKWEAFTVDAAAVYTNMPPSGSYRAFGASHLQWIGEMQIDELAEKCGLDPLEIRKRNLLKPGEVVREGGKPLDSDLIGNMMKVADALKFHEPKAKWTGRGVSIGLLAAGAHPVSVAIVRMHADGSALVLTSTTEMGQGAQTVMGQVAASELGISPDRVRVLHSDTNFTPYDRSTGASRSTTLSGKAIQLAARDVREKLLKMAASQLGKSVEELSVEDGMIVCGDTRVSYEDVIAAHFGLVGGEVVGVGEVRPETGSGSYAEGPVFWEVCVAGAEVEVDPDTGEVTVNHLVTVADVGKAINPDLIEVQEHGAAMQGLGNVLLEEMVFQDGQLLNPSIVDYRIPGWNDLPKKATGIVVENEDGPGPFGAKGVGEGALAGVLGAIAAAVRDAGVDVTELPLQPERVWRALQKQKQQAAEAVTESA